ncbi:MAG: fluoride efflux transporter CrcB [Candidatus Omnitrophica bacterium]|nr:fluoride efflux transporter CrcB [Candidatus Omnitrophota bacterium]MCB9747873.1 fluoride efflux transporter CrcB [Candidatus Omnitrophota bacterium]
MFKILVVGLGGFFGSISRYLLSNLVFQLSGQHWFPLGTLTVNVLGCLTIGWLAGLAEVKAVFSEEVRLFLLVGFLGGFTTFSSFGHETVNLFRDSQNLFAMLNISLQIGLCLGAAWLGYHIANISL